jgi:hypothetical protein
MLQGARLKCLGAIPAEEKDLAGQVIHLGPLALIKICLKHSQIHCRLMISSEDPVPPHHQ